jgi:hypothetical protein
MSRLDELYLEGEPDFLVSAQCVREVRTAIAHGLYATAEIERVRIAQECAEAAGQSWPRDATPVLPAQSLLDTIKPMAEALLWLEQAHHMRRVSSGN